MAFPDRLTPFFLSSLAIALTAMPVVAQVIPAADGTGTIVQPNGNQFTIDGGAASIDGQNLFHSFQELGLSPAQIANFRSTPTIQNIFARITGGNPSIVQGLLQVSGGPSNLFLINPSGILFSPTARLDLPGGFVATTATGLDFGAGPWASVGSQAYQNLVGSPIGFQFANDRPGSIVNLGTLNLTPGQSLGLVGGSVVNTGTIQTAGGQVTIAAIPGSNYLRLSQPGSLLAYELQPIAPTTARSPSLPELLTGIDRSQANALVVQANGDVALQQTGQTLVSGTIDVAGKSPGTVQILGDRVQLTDATITATGQSQGGTALIGGDYRGQGRVPNAQQTRVNPGSTIDVSAIQNGNGGRAIVWANQQTNFAGKAIARGGAAGGNGGFIEISGKENLQFAGRTDAGALAGNLGTVLFDPRNIRFTAAGSTVLPQPNGVPANSFPNLDLDFSPNVLLNNTGNLIFEASDTITIDAPLFATGVGDLTFRAGQQFIANANILTTERNLLIAAPLIRVGNVNTAQGLPTIPSVTGTITLQGQQIETGQLSTPLGRSVQLTGNQITAGDIATIGISAPSVYAAGGDLLSPTQTPWVGGGGAVNIQGTGTINLQRIRTDQGTITIDAGLGPAAGDVSTNYLASLGGDINIQARSVNLGSIGTGPYTTRAAGGNVTINTFGDLIAGGIDFSGTNGLAGNVALKSLQGNLKLDVLVAAGEKGGNVDLTGENVRITGTWGNGPSSINVPGNIRITHRGGLTNQPFRIGSNTGTNGTAGTIAVRTTLLANTVIPLLPRNFSTADGRIQIIDQTPMPSIVPILPSPPTLNPPPVLNPPSVLNPPPTVQPTVTVQPTASVQPTATVRSPASVQSTATPIAALPLTASPDRTASLSRNPNTIAPIEQRLTQEFSQGLNLGAGEGTAAANAAANPVSLMQQIAGITGVKPALIYISFVAPTADGMAPRSRDQLELTLVTAKGITRHRPPAIDRATFQAIATQLRQTVANPVRTNTKTYLPAAQQLYQWLIQPLAAELSQQQITNLVFLPEAGARAIPFAALHDGQGFLVERFSISLMPSLTLTDTRYRDLRQTSVLAIGIAASTQGQLALPTVPTEIDTVLALWPQGDRFLDQQVTVANLRQARQQKPYGIVHLATHANFVSNSQENSYIQLWNQQLQLDQIRQLGWNNPPIDLLVLSACRTAIGDQQSELGFAGIALQTGVKTTLASLWSVSDVATSALMGDFYDQLRRSPIKAEALRQTQMRMIHHEVRLSEQGIEGIVGLPHISLPENTIVPNYNLDHPYYWAAFSMVGNPW